MAGSVQSESGTGAGEPQRRAAALFLPHRAAFARASTLTLGIVACQILLLLALESVLGAVLGGEKGLGAWAAKAVPLALALLALAFLRWRQPEAQLAAERAFTDDVRGRLLQALLERPASFWAKAEAGDLALRLSEDVTGLLGYVRARHQLLWIAPLRLLAFTAILYYLAPALLPAVLLVVPLVSLTVLGTGKGLAQIARRGRKARGGEASYLARVLSSAEILQAYDGRRQVVTALAEHSRRVFDEGARLSKLSNLGVQLSEALRLVGIVVVLVWGQGLVAAGALSGEVLLVSVPILFLLYAPVIDLVRLRRRLAEGHESALAVGELLPASNVGAMESVELPGFSEELALENISFAYESAHPVLKNATLRIHPREWTALVGPSGAGKTTLLRLLLGMEPVREGRIMLDGKDVTVAAASSVRGLCALVTQDPVLPERTVRGNLLLAKPDASEAELWQALEAAGLAERLRRAEGAGLDADVGERGHGFSGGERERIALARALLSPAPILFLDEPTTFLDPVNRERLIERLVREKSHRSLLVISHEPSLIERADRVYRLENGMLSKEHSVNDTSKIVKSVR